MGDDSRDDEDGAEGKNRIAEEWIRRKSGPLVKELMKSVATGIVVSIIVSGLVFGTQISPFTSPNIQVTAHGSTGDEYEVRVANSGNIKAEDVSVLINSSENKSIGRRSADIIIKNQEQSFDFNLDSTNQTTVANRTNLTILDEERSRQICRLASRSPLGIQLSATLLPTLNTFQQANSNISYNSSGTVKYDNKTAFHVETQRYEQVERVPMRYNIVVKNGENVTQDTESFRYPQNKTVLTTGPVQETITPIIIGIQFSSSEGCSVNGQTLINSSDLLA